jgi:CRISPR/Cas system-associated protein Cas7 (RAMP superfamily)
MDLLKIGVNVVDWIGLAQDRYRRRALVNAVMNLRVP